jgi:hypothetical protein
MWFRIVDTTINGTDSEDYLWQTGNLGSAGIIFDASRWPVHFVQLPFGSAASWTPLRGKEDPGALVSGAPATTDLLLLNNQFTSPDDLSVGFTTRQAGTFGSSASTS